jgi:hypothetical protein
MKVRSGHTCWLTALLLAAGLATGCSEAPQKRVNVSGTVTNFDGKKVNGVTLVLRYDGHEREVTVRDGTFFFPGADTGAVKAYLRYAPRVVGPPLPPGASAEEKRLFQEAYGDANRPVTPNLARRYFQPATSNLVLEIKNTGPNRFDLKLEKL